MTYDRIKTKLLRENRLLDCAASMQASDDEVYTVDRHVLHSDRARFKDLPMPIRDLGILLGLDLLRDWTRAAEEIPWLFISKPLLSIDGDWLAALPNATPPSVAVSLAKSAAQFDPMNGPRGEKRQPDFELSVPADFSGLDCRYFERVFERGEPPETAWCLRVDNGRFP